MHFCKWCQKRMSGSHRQHRDNPDYKSKMQISKELKEKLEQEFYSWANSGIWKSKNEDTVFLGIGNVSEWWIKKIKELNENN